MVSGFMMVKGCSCEGVSIVGGAVVCETGGADG